MESLEATVFCFLPAGLLEISWNKCQNNGFGAIAKMTPPFFFLAVCGLVRRTQDVRASKQLSIDEITPPLRPFVELHVEMYFETQL